MSDTLSVSTNLKEGSEMNSRRILVQILPKQVPSNNHPHRAFAWHIVSSIVSDQEKLSTVSYTPKPRSQVCSYCMPRMAHRSRRVWHQQLGLLPPSHKGRDVRVSWVCCAWRIRIHNGYHEGLSMFKGGILSRQKVKVGNRRGILVRYPCILWYWNNPGGCEREVLPRRSSLQEHIGCAAEDVGLFKIFTGQNGKAWYFYLGKYWGCFEQLFVSYAIKSSCWNESLYQPYIVWCPQRSVKILWIGIFYPHLSNSPLRCYENNWLNYPYSAVRNATRRLGCPSLWPQKVRTMAWQVGSCATNGFSWTPIFFCRLCDSLDASTGTMFPEQAPFLVLIEILAVFSHGAWTE